MKAVLDPIVIVSGLLSSDGPPGKILEMWFRGDFELVISPKLADELERVLGYPKIRKRITKEESDESMQLLLRWASHADDPTEASSIRSSDPDDDYLIALAEASATALVSCDKVLLRLNSTLPIYSPRDFLNLIQD